MQMELHHGLLEEVTVDYVAGAAQPKLLSVRNRRTPLSMGFDPVIRLTRLPCTKRSVLLVAGPRNHPSL